MVVLITGASHTGKTLLAQRLLEQCRWPYLSIDLLKMGLIRSGQTALTPEDDRELEAYLWPILREMVKTAIENRQNLIVEGGYIPLDWAEDLPPEHRGQIRFFCLVMSEGYIWRHFGDIKAHANAIEQRLDDSGCTLETVLEENAYYRDQCRRHNWQPVLIQERYHLPLQWSPVRRTVWKAPRR